MFFVCLAKIDDETIGRTLEHDQLFRTLLERTGSIKKMQKISVFCELRVKEVTGGTQNLHSDSNEVREIGCTRQTHPSNTLTMHTTCTAFLQLARFPDV
jgi:hypothetical protein